MRSATTRLVAFAIALVTSLGMVLAGFVAPAHAAPTPMIVIEQNHLEGDHKVPFDIEDFGPGDTRAAQVAVRNDTDRAAQVAYGGATFRDDSLSRYVWLALRHDGVELAQGRVDSARIRGASFEVAPRTTSTLDLELTMHRDEGNDAQGASMRVEIDFAVTGGTAPIKTGVAPDGSPLPAGGNVDTETLPPTGESLGAFHLLVWATLAAFAAGLVALFLVALRRRYESAQPRPVPLTIFDDLDDHGDRTAR